MGIGYTLVCATNHGLHARVSTQRNHKLTYRHKKNDEENVQEWDLHYDVLGMAAKAGGFYSYVAGTAAVILNHTKFLNRKSPHATNGLNIYNYKTTLPMKKGLSSSAAVCVLVATAFNLIFDLGLDQAEIMEIAYQVRFCIISAFYMTYLPM